MGLFTALPRYVERVRSLQLLPQKRVPQRRHERPLRVVGGPAVTAFDVLVVDDVVALLLEPGDHLAGVAGVDAVVAGGSGEERAGVLHVLRGVVVRGERSDELPLAR